MSLDFADIHVAVTDGVQALAVERQLNADSVLRRGSIVEVVPEGEPEVVGDPLAASAVRHVRDANTVGQVVVFRRGCEKPSTIAAGCELSSFAPAAPYSKTRAGASPGPRMHASPGQRRAGGGGGTFRGRPRSRALISERPKNVPLGTARQRLPGSSVVRVSRRLQSPASRRHHSNPTSFHVRCASVRRPSVPGLHQ